MSEKPDATGPVIQALARKIEKVTGHIKIPCGKGKFEVRNHENEARWYVAYQIAELMREDYTTKDWAHFVLEGMQPLTDEDVKDHFYPEGDGDASFLPTPEELLRWFRG